MRRQNDKQREENMALQESMHVAASNAATELQTKDKRIRQLERKVIKIIYHFSKILDWPVFQDTIFARWASFQGTRIFRGTGTHWPTDECHGIQTR